MNEKKIVVYTVNFGNYRNELEDGMDTLNFDPRIDYIFYTEQADIQSDHWIVNKIKLNEPPPDTSMDQNRYNSKYSKFNIPDNLIDYDVVVWIDSKIIKRKAVLPTYESIINRINNRKILFHRHRERDTVLQELDVTIENNLEENSKRFYDKIQDIDFELPLVDSCIMIYRNEVAIHKFLRKVFEIMIQYRLKRDQNVIPYAFSLSKDHLSLADVDLTLGRPESSGNDIMSKEFIKRNFKKKHIAILIWGIPRSLEYTYRSITNSIFTPLERNGICFDILIHTYHVQYYNNVRAKEYTTVMNNTQHLYLPYKSIMIESDSSVRENLNLSEYHSHDDFFKNNFNTVNNSVLSFYSKKQAISMMVKDKNKYDYVMFLRPDCYYYEPLSLSYFDLVKEKELVAPNFHLTHNFNDRFAICTVSDSFTYANAFNSLLDYSKKEVVHPETFLMYHLTRHNCKVNLVDFYFARIRLNNIMAIKDQIIYEERIKKETYTGEIVPYNLKSYFTTQILIFTIIIFMILGMGIITLLYDQPNRKNIYVILPLLILSIVGFLVTIGILITDDESPGIFVKTFTVLSLVFLLTAFACIFFQKLNHKAIIIITYTPYLVWVILYNVLIFTKY